MAAKINAHGLNVVRGINTQTGTTYTLALTDAGGLVTCSNGSAITVTVPTNASVAGFRVGTEICIQQLGAGTVTIAAAGGVTINTPSTLVINAQYGEVRLRKIGTDTWAIVGSNLTDLSNVIARSGQLDVTNTVTKTAVWSFTVPANALGTNKTIAIDAIGDFLNTTTNRIVTLELAFGSTVLWTDASASMTAAAARHPWAVRILLSAQGATNVQVMGGFVALGTSAATTTGLGDVGAIFAATTGMNTAIYGSAAEDTTAARTFELRVTLAAASTQNSFRIQSGIAYMLGEGKTGQTGATGQQGVGASSIPENAQSGTTYTLVLTDKGKVVVCTNASPITLTVPLNSSVAFTAGDVVYVCQGGAGAVTIAATGGVTLKKPYTLVTAIQDAWLSLVYMGSDVWRVTGQST